MPYLYDSVLYALIVWVSFNTLPNNIIYFEGRKVFEYQTETDLLYEINLELKIKVRNIEDGMLYYGCKDLGLLCRKW